MRALGLMSGTSLDGIDVADVEVSNPGGRIEIELLHFSTVPFGPELRAALVESLPPHPGSTACVAELNFALGEAFADAVMRSLSEWKLKVDAIDVIGSHGHTLYHAPDAGVTLQIGEPAVIAALTGVTCVADFRPADVALGGQGAPLVPFVDRALFASEVEWRAVLNVGGIANVTLLQRGGSAEDTCAFDTGPGNMTIDECARLASDGRLACDEDGNLASRGTAHGPLLAELLAHPYFSVVPPKSTGREVFGSEYARRLWDRGLSEGLQREDIVATATALSARTIAAAIPHECERVIVSGGGAHNAALMKMLHAEIRDRAAKTKIDLSDVHGIPVDAKEAIAFAILACEAINGRENHLPRCTGARRASILGKIVPGSNYRLLLKAIVAG